MLDYHAQTKHSYASVRKRSGGMDWETKPNVFKIYQSQLERIFLDLENPMHHFLYRIGGVSATKTYPTMSYSLRINPSAGALYPTEVYVQIRDVKGFKNGLYHFCPAESSLVLLHTLEEKEGVESALHVKRLNGFLFLFSALYFRSSWKYGNRAFRYCLQDTGHMLGALEASSTLLGTPYEIHYDFDRKALNTLFGFGAEEFFLSAACVGETEATPTHFPTTSLSTTDGTGTFERNTMIETAYEATCNTVAPKAQTKQPHFTLEPHHFKRTLLARRSAREFYENTISKEAFETIMAYICQPIPSDTDTSVRIYAVIHRVKEMWQGIWYNGAYLKAGNFVQKAGYLCLEQALGAQSAVTFFLLGEEENYQALMQKAGILGHRLYLIANTLGIGCSGIGAYYDDEVTDFLETDGMVLYALAIGT